MIPDGKTMYHAEVFLGLHPDFMVKAHLLIPEGEENLLYNWMLNFQYMSDEYVRMYKTSKPLGDEPDVYIFSDRNGRELHKPMSVKQNACVISIRRQTVPQYWNEIFWRA